MVLNHGSDHGVGGFGFPVPAHPLQCCCVSVGGWECESPISRSSDSLSLSATGKWVGCAGEIGIRNYGMELGYVR